MSLNIDNNDGIVLMMMIWEFQRERENTQRERLRYIRWECWSVEGSNLGESLIFSEY